MLYLPPGAKLDGLKLPARGATGGGRGRSGRDVVYGASDQAVGRDTLDCVDILERSKGFRDAIGAADAAERWLLKQHR